MVLSFIPGITLTDQLLFITSGGDNEELKTSVELIDLSGRGLQCQRPSDFPVRGNGHSSLKNEQGNPLVCGGIFSNETEISQQCYQYQPEIDSWEAGPTTMNERYYSPTAEVSAGKYLIAGEGFRLATSEPLDYDFNTEIYQNGEFTLGPDLPDPFIPFFERPCVAKISEDRTFYSDGYIAMVYDWSLSNWTDVTAIGFSSIVQ